MAHKQLPLFLFLLQYLFLFQDSLYWEAAFALHAKDPGVPGFFFN